MCWLHLPKTHLSFYVSFGCWTIFLCFHGILTTFLKGEHSNTERGYLSAVLQPKLQSMLANERSEEGDAIEVVVSKVDKDPLTIM